jgi:hypothetical protein
MIYWSGELLASSQFDRRIPALMPNEPQFDDSIREELTVAGDRDVVSGKKASDKKNYAEALSRRLALRFANLLRRTFPSILPRADGAGQESKARTAKGFKRLDVNYSTTELGLGLGLSIKTINFRDGKTKRYTKNYTRADNELRAEASDYHERQPYAVMIAVVFMPADACDDGSARIPSSFGQAVQIFRARGGREKPADLPALFELVLIGLYEVSPDRFGDVVFFDVRDAPPKNGRPKELRTLVETIDLIVQTYDRRNKPPSYGQMPHRSHLSFLRPKRIRPKKISPFIQLPEPACAMREGLDMVGGR